MDPKKIATIRDWKTPTSVKKVQSFLRLANYYKRFILRFEYIALPLINLTKKNETFRWTKRAQKAFNRLKEAITSKPVLVMFDPTRPVKLKTDASNYVFETQLK